MLDADRVCSSDRGVVSHLSMPPLVLAACASNLFFFFWPSPPPPPPAFLQSLFCKIKTSPSPHVENGKPGLAHQRADLFTTCAVGSLLYGGGRKARATLPAPKAARPAVGEREGKTIRNRCKFSACLVQAILLSRGHWSWPSRQNICEYPGQNAIVLAAPGVCARQCHRAHTA